MFPKRRRRYEDDLKRELHSHLDAEAEEQRESGVRADEARYQARRLFGKTTLVKEDTRQVWRWLWFEQIAQDLRYAVRMLLRRPVFTVSAILLLALVIGANTILFSIVDAALLRSLPFRDPSRIVAVWERPPRNVQWKRQTLPFDDFLELQRNNRSFETVAAASGRRYTLIINGRPESVIGEAVTAGYLPMLGMPAARGRTFLPTDRGGFDVVLSYGLWSRLFGGHDVIGRAINLNSKAYTIVGVMPVKFPFPSLDEGPPELWTLLSSDDEQFRTNPGRVSVVGRLRPSVAPAVAESEAAALLRQSHNHVPVSSRPPGMIVRGLQADRAEFTKPVLAALSAAVGFVLLIACANVAGLLLGRASERRQEIAVRYSLGAPRKRVVRQLLTENILLWALAGAMALLLSMVGVKLLLPFAIKSLHEFPRLNPVMIDSRAAAYSVMLTFLTGILFGLVPALQGSRLNLATTLKEGSRSLLSSRRMHYWRRALVASEVSFCVILLLGAGLVLKSLVRLASQPLGFRPDKVFTFKIELPREDYKQPVECYNLYDRLLERMHHLPGVEAAAATSALPLEGTVVSSFSVLGHPVGRNSFMLAGNEAISPDYFRTIGMRVFAGRTFNAHDSERSERVAIINQTLAHRYFPNENPIGKRIKHGDDASASPWLTIVGVVGDVKHAGLDWDYLPEIYLPYRQLSAEEQELAPQMSFVLRASGRGTLGDQLRAAVASVNSNLPVVEMKTMSEIVSASELPSRFNSTIFAVFAGLSLLLAAVGLYGVVSQSASQRRQEIGIRIALGATPPKVIGSIIKEGMQLALIGAIAGLAGGLALTRFLSSLLYHVSATDVSTAAGVSVVLLLITIVATYVPARRATEVDPISVLRCE